MCLIGPCQVSEVRIIGLRSVVWGLLCSVTYRLTGSFVPDLIVSMSHQMWLHLQSDESVGSIGFKINYKGTRTAIISHYLGVYVWTCLVQEADDFILLSASLSIYWSACLASLLFPSQNLSTTQLGSQTFTWTFIDNIKEGEKVAWSTWLDLILFFSLSPPPLLTSTPASHFHRNWQRELWWPWHTPVRLPRG